LQRVAAFELLFFPSGEMPSLPRVCDCVRRFHFIPLTRRLHSDVQRDSQICTSSSRVYRSFGEKFNNALAKVINILNMAEINVHLCFVSDDVFLPKDIDLDSTEIDETEREVEYFKRYAYCHIYTHTHTHTRVR